MLIELRSSATDPHNAPNKLFQNFKETLILKPNSKIALVSALTTTNKTDGFKIDETNDRFEMKIGTFDPIEVVLTKALYSGDALATEITTKIKTAFNLLGGGTTFSSLFYPEMLGNEPIATYKIATGFEILILYNPQGFTATEIGSDIDTAITKTRVDEFAGEWITANLTTEQTVGNVYRGFNCLNPVVPYQFKSSANDFYSVVSLKSLHIGRRPIQLELGTHEHNDEGTYLMETVGNLNGSGGGTNFTHNWDIYMGVGATNYGYDYTITQNDITGATISVLYAQLDPLDPTNKTYNINPTHTDPVNGFQNQAIIQSAIDPSTNQVVGTGYNYGSHPSGGLVSPPILFTPAVGGTTIPRSADNMYQAVVQVDGTVNVMYNGTILNATNNTTIEDGDGLRAYVNALDSIHDQEHAPKFQIKKLGSNNWVDILLDHGNTLPPYNASTRLIPQLRMDGDLSSGCWGTGANGQTLATTAFAEHSLSVSNMSVNWFNAGEVLYQIGASTPAGLTGFKGMAKCGTTVIGSSGGLTGVLPMRGFTGTGMANGMTFQVKGVKSGYTATITVNSVALAIATINSAGTGYVNNTVYETEWIAGANNNEYPYPQTGRHIRRTPTVRVQVGGGGAITGFDILDTGEGLVPADGLRVVGGNNDGVLVVNITAQDTSQVVVDVMPTKAITWLPMTPQHSGQIDLSNNGNSSFGNDFYLRPEIFNGSFNQITVAQPVPNIVSVSRPPFNNPANENILVNIPNFPIGSRNSQGNTDNHIATIPYQTDLDSLLENHKQHYEPFNMLYHRLDNERDLNLNHIEVELTNHDGTLRTDLQHPTQITISITPDYK